MDITYENIEELRNDFISILISAMDKDPSAELASHVKQEIDKLFTKYELDIQIEVKPGDAGDRMTIVWIRPIDQLCARALLEEHY